MLIGAHVRTGGTLVGALERGRTIGADVVQVFTQSPRMWRPSRHAADVLARYREAQAADSSIVATYCHASYLVNLATQDPSHRERSRAALTANLSAARGMGASGLVVHVGSHLGKGFDAVARRVADGLLVALEKAVDPVAAAGAAHGGAADGAEGTSCPILIENTAGAGGSIGATFEELAVLLELADADGEIGICVDTQHLWASGVPFGTPTEADDVVAALDATVGLGALRCLHLNDSKVPFGARADRHANLGEGTTGDGALACLLGHPALDGLPAILEVAGSGDGPRAADIRLAREIHRSGQLLWAAEWKKRPERPTRRATEWATKEER